MLGSKHRRRADDLAERLDTAHQTIEQLTADLETARYNEQRAIRARENAEDVAAAQRNELVARAGIIRGLGRDPLARENASLKAHATALEKRLAELQAANESAYWGLAKRMTNPAPAKDTIEPVGGAA